MEVLLLNVMNDTMTTNGPPRAGSLAKGNEWYHNTGPPPIPKGNEWYHNTGPPPIPKGNEWYHNTGPPPIPKGNEWYHNSGPPPIPKGDHVALRPQKRRLDR